MKRHFQHSIVLSCLGLPLAGFAATCPGPATNAFTGCYYSNTTLSGDPVFIRTDPQINFYWGNRSPDPSLPPLDFSARWQGNFTFSQGTYSFYAVASDGMRVYVDGNLTIDTWRDQPPYGYSGTQSLSQGTHLVTVEYYERQGGATAQVSWQNIAPATPAAPVISSFTATPASVTPGQPVTLSWSVSGASSIGLDTGVGDVTNLSGVTVKPTQTTVYTLTASNSVNITAATVKVTVQASGTPVDTQPPTAPALTSALVVSATEVDLTWSASTDNVGVAGYQILRNGTVVGSVSGTTLTYADASLSANFTYAYAVQAFDAAKNYSAASNNVQVSTPAIATSPAPAGCPPPAANAFTGCYYNNTTLSGNPVFIRTDPQINFYWGNRSPDPSLPPLDFSARWQGNFTFSQGTYSFYAIASDGIRVYIDGNLIIDSWRDEPAYGYSAIQSISHGTHLVTVEYYERQGGATVQLSWLNTAPATPAAPVISSFTATPASVTPGQPMILSWSVSGASSIRIDNGIGDVTNRSNVTVSPTQTTVYMLTASNSAGTATATAKVTVQAGGGSPVDMQPPTAPGLTSALVMSATEVDLAWSASTDNLGVAGYEILRNGTVVGSVSGTPLVYADTGLTGNTTYTYTIQAYDAAKNYSEVSNSLQILTLPDLTGISVNWLGACWQPLTIQGITGNFQAIDFILTTPTPVPVQGTLFFAPNCDPSQGTDNMNDFNTLTGASHMIRGFTHAPDVIPSSAYYWVGPLTNDGKCAPGAPCSGCVNYTKATPLCSMLP